MTRTWGQKVASCGVWLVMWFTGFTVSATSAQDCFGIVDMGTMGGFHSEAHAVSADGFVVVGHVITTSGDRHAFRWTANEGVQDLGTLGGANSWANAVSADGSVVVGSSNSASGHEHAFRWTAGGGMQDLGTLGGLHSVARGVSADGSIVVGSSNTASGPGHAFRWTTAGGMQDLGTLAGGSVSDSHAISADGSVVVGYSKPASGYEHAFRWTTAGGMQDLGTLGGANSWANAVSADGSVVVGRSFVSPTYNAFRWTAGGGMEDLGTLVGFWTDARAVSASGSVVVGRSYTASGDYHAFRWTASGGMQDLGTLEGDNSWAHGVSADGFVVVGGSDTDSGTFHAVRWGSDSDGDGLLDCWETNGIDINADGIIDLDLPAMGARVDRKDIFVEVDAMVGRAPTLAELQGVTNAFDQAPVPAPSSGGQGGIALHILIDETNIARAPFPGAFTDFDAIKAVRYGTAAERANPNWANIKAARDKSFRYCIFADTYSGSNSSGLAEYPGNDFMVTLGGWTPAGGTADQRAGTFMHELGHTLGLGHGGSDRTHYKPNYYSVMNYRWQTPQSSYASLWRLDYSREALAPLNETALDESASLGATRPEYAAVQVPFTTTANTWAWANLAGGFMVDWNGDGMTPAGQPVVAADINRQSPIDSPGALTSLTGFNDWANLRYALTGNPNFGDGRDETTIDDEFDLTEFEINEQIPPPPPLCDADLNNDGVLDFFDIQTFLNWFAAGDPRADFTPDGEFDFFDVQAFLNAFASGCP